MQEIWRFPTNGYGGENGLDTSDMEMFKKDPISALAREICQNTIDAYNTKLGNNNCPRVEFEIFEIKTKNIPGYQRLKEEIEKCYNYQENSEKESKALSNMLKCISSDTMKCLRVSDYNTTGLCGISTTAKNTPFYNLTKGSGVSNKSNGAGGSKGIGKYASFVVSSINTVFFATKTIENEVGYVGITKLRSVPVSSDGELLTNGVGYYSADERNHPVLNQIRLDKVYERNESGTDIYILGFNDEEEWKDDIITAVLDSFMVAIFKGKIEIVVDNILINSQTIDKIIDTKSYLQHSKKNVVKGIIAQYNLLKNGDNVSCKNIDVEGSSITVYVMSYKKTKINEATKQCVMVRYPYMKITHTTGHSYVPYSALCIIEKSSLGEKLRFIENPQHTDWEIKRLNNDKAEKKVTLALKKKLETAVTEYIREILTKTDSDTTDVEGAGEYLPSTDNGEEGINELVVTEVVNVNPIRKVKNKKKKKKQRNADDGDTDDEEINNPDGENGDAGTSEDDGIGEEGSNGGNAVPSGADGNSGSSGAGGANGNSGSSGAGGTNGNSGSSGAGGTRGNDGSGSPGNTKGSRSYVLNNVVYHILSKDKKNGRFNILCKVNKDIAKCDLKIVQTGSTEDKYDINIITAKVGNIDCNVVNGKLKDISLKKNELTTIECVLDIKENFAGEVEFNAYR